ncbi:CapA family protein [Butyrivibrio sp. YAB3001]|uniref:CapA family protein n=1 Tax=Butyrivibrio sp. YAB3001 TaxID=1520812 RepID=UPI0008F65C4C|nr:CapA family protein [Butyrivibrio sp. YAB3001]SFB76480.1 poly-gamma-glutamate synthesis protein (capsule biosynthesis protein) [Butyrivibrio sp. YAB3001]
MGKREYYNRKTDNNVLKRAIIAFTTTFIGIMLIGVIVLLVISSGLKSETPSEGSEDLEANYFPKTVKIEKIEKAVQPETSTQVMQEEEESSENTEEKIEIEIPEEDREYTYLLEPTNEDSITLGFAGDILFDDNYAAGNAFRVHGNSAAGVIGTTLLNRMNQVDIMMVNNEFPYSDRGTPTEGKKFTFRARPQTASILHTMGVDIVGLANNHAYDYGEQALLDTFDALSSQGIAYVGAGRNIDEASHTVYYVTPGGMKIAFICATQIERLQNPDTKEATSTSPGVFRCLDDSLLLTRIKEAKEKGAYVVVFIHWGTESTTELDYLQKDQAIEIVQAGADAIIGSHPHILQRMDYIQGVPVVYSLGNYIFNSKTLDTCMVVLTINKEGTVSMQMIPALQSDCTVNEATGEEAQRIYNKIMGMSPGISIDGEGFIRAQ